MADVILTVWQTNQYASQVLSADPVLSNINVRGEISNYKNHPSGHKYFTLKDSNSHIECVMYRTSAYGLDFEPREGMQVVVSGSVVIWPEGGKYQIKVLRMRKEGTGELYVRFEQLKRRLLEEGLFNEANKKPLPLLPRRVGLVTSANGAAVHDMIRVLRARMPKIDIVICPVAVQGAGAAEDIARGIDRMDRYGNADVMLVGRGGGSIEDLWAFNEEPVAYAIFRAKTPVISCVGHEVDTTIADFVADERAATPSNGAEKAVPVYDDLYDLIDTYENRVRRSVITAQSLRRAKLERLMRSPCLSAPREMWIGNGAHKLERLEARMKDAWEKQQMARNAQVDGFRRTLTAIDPVRVIDRGYAYLEQHGEILSDAKKLDPAETLSIHMRDGAVTAALTATEDKSE